MKRSCTIAAMLMVIAAAVLAAVPQLITYQGRLTSSAGAPFTGNKLMKFTLYNVNSAAVWNSGFITIACSDGLFSVNLGASGQPALPTTIFSDTGITLGITVDVDPEISPRTRLTSQSFSYHALYADTSEVTKTIADNSVTSAKILDGTILFGDIAQNGATLNQIIRWTGAAWVAVKDSVGLAGRSITADTALVAKAVLDNTVTSVKIVNGTIAFVDIGQNGAATNQVMKWNGSAWAAANDDVGAGGAYLPLAGGTMTGPITNTGNPDITMGKGNFGVLNSNSGPNSFVAGYADTASAIYTTVAGGYRNSATVEGAAIAGGKWNLAAGLNSFVAGVYDTVIGSNSTVSGGAYNSVPATYGTISGGYKNYIGSSWAAVAGGYHNYAAGLASFVAGYYNYAAGYATVSGGIRNVANGYASFIGGGEVDTTAGYYSTVAGGIANVALDSAATVCGGNGNRATGMYSFVGGGGGIPLTDANYASGRNSAITGGSSNNAASDWSAIGGGKNNTISGIQAVIGGGSYNVASEAATTIAGGTLNIAEGRFSSIGGGYADTAAGYMSAIGGGLGNLALDSCAIIGGGNKNRALGSYSVVAGGQFNKAGNDWSAVGGGLQNDASGSFACIAGGQENAAVAGWAHVAAGYGNVASGLYSTIGGGAFNRARGAYSVVGGGGSDSNSAQGAYSTISGGRGNASGGQESTVGGGFFNLATGLRSTVPGGEGNHAIGDYSFAAGYDASADHEGSFVWSDHGGGYFTSSAANEFSVRAIGGTRIYSSWPPGPVAGVFLAPGSGAWASISDSAAKRNIRPVDGEEILRKLAQLPVSRWSYKSQDPSIEHIGPMAQDFYALFGIGENDTTISTIDPAGIALAAIKELIIENRQLKAEIQQIPDLKARLEKLEHVIAEMQSGANNQYGVK